jgi:hypothetical protein
MTPAALDPFMRVRSYRIACDAAFQNCRRVRGHAEIRAMTLNDSSMTGSLLGGTSTISMPPSPASIQTPHAPVDTS